MIISAATFFFTARCLRCAYRRAAGTEAAHVWQSIYSLYELVFFFVFFHWRSYFVKTLHRSNGLIYSSVTFCSHISFYPSNQRHIYHGLHAHLRVEPFALQLRLSELNWGGVKM